MGTRIPVEDSAPTVAFEDAVQFVFDALGEVPDFRDPRGTQIELHGTLALTVLSAAAGHPSYRGIEAYGKLREDTLIPLFGIYDVRHRGNRDGPARGELVAPDGRDADHPPAHGRRLYVHGNPPNDAPRASLNRPCQPGAQS